MKKPRGRRHLYGLKRPSPILCIDCLLLLLHCVCPLPLLRPPLYTLLLLLIFLNLKKAHCFATLLLFSFLSLLPPHAAAMKDLGIKSIEIVPFNSTLDFLGQISNESADNIVIKGEARIALNRPLKLRAMTVKFKGVSNTFVRGCETSIPILPKLKQALFSKANLPVGEHVIPFQLSVPNIYPASLSSKRANISYKVELSIAIGLQKKAITAEHPIELRRHLLRCKEMAPLVETQIVQDTVPAKFHYEIDAPQIVCREQRYLPVAVKYLCFASQKPVQSIRTQLTQIELFRYIMQCRNDTDKHRLLPFDADIYCTTDVNPFPNPEATAVLAATRHAKDSKRLQIHSPHQTVTKSVTSNAQYPLLYTKLTATSKRLPGNDRLFYDISCNSSLRLRQNLHLYLYIINSKSHSNSSMNLKISRPKSLSSLHLSHHSRKTLNCNSPMSCHCIISNKTFHDYMILSSPKYSKSHRRLQKVTLWMKAKACSLGLSIVSWASHILRFLSHHPASIFSKYPTTLPIS